MQFLRTFMISLLVAVAVSAQTPEDRLRSTIASVRYGALAEAARVQGDVHVKVDGGVVTLLSGPPLLARAAMESAKALGSLQGKMNLDVTYHFRIVDTAASVVVQTTVQRGNALGRAVLRLLRLKPDKLILEHVCQEGVAPPSDFKVANAVIEIWVYGRTLCLQTETVTAIPNP